MVQSPFRSIRLVFVIVPKLVGDAGDEADNEQGDEAAACHFVTSTNLNYSSAQYVQVSTLLMP